jgi:predicted Zn-dependent protease/thioredoxin-like negative regulator of GroEL
MNQRLVRTGLAALFVAALGAASARPARAQQVQLYGGGTVKKPTAKQRLIDRLLFTAQYFLLHERDLDAAAAEYRKVMKLDKGNVMAGMALADIEIQRKKPKQALKVLEGLGRKSKTDGRVWRALALAYKSGGDDKKMVAACKKALTIDPRDGEALWLLFERALMRYKSGNQAARGELEAAASGYIRSGYLAQGPQHRLVERTLVELSGDELALTVYDAKTAYQTAFSDGGMGSINQQMGEARRGFEKCVADAPERQECHYYLGLVYGSVKASESYSPSKARASLRKAPDLPEAHVELARLMRVDDDLDAAATELGKALKLSPGMAQAHLELGIVRKLDGNEEAAVASFVAAYEADRFSSSADRAVAELAKVRPRHPLVTGQMMFGDLKGGDVFATDRFKAAVKMVEEQLGGVDDAAPEKAVLEEILSRIRRSGDVSSRFSFRVSVLKTPMVNAFALPDGSIYFTRGMFDFVKKKWPRRKLDASNDVLGHVMAHEMAHVIRRHTLQTLIYREAVTDSSRALDPAVLTHVTRLHEVEADREGIVLAFLGGYHPRGGIEFMEVSGTEMEIPTHLDHPTYEERVHYLEEYWSNDVKYAFVSFRLGLDSLDKAASLEAKSAPETPQAYEEAADHFKRFRTSLKATKEVLNNLGIAYAKLGVIQLASSGTPLSRWQTRFSIERESALKYVSVHRAEEESRTRGGARRPGKAGPAIPWQLREATGAFEEALKIDPGYTRARLNLALVHLALGKPAEAQRRLAAIKGASGERDLLLGVAAAEQNDWRTAEAALVRASKTRGLERAARFNLARLYQVSNRREQARTAYKAYLAQDKSTAWARAAEKALKAL